MPRYIDAEELAEHKFFGVTFDRYVSDGRPKSEEEIYAYKVGYNDAIDRIVRFAPTADVVERKDLDTITEAHEQIGYEKGYRDGYAQATVEAVRCKDCKHYKPSEADQNRKMCWRKDVDGWFVCYDFYPTDYCSYGERREDERTD